MLLKLAQNLLSRVLGKPEHSVAKPLEESGGAVGEAFGHRSLPRQYTGTREENPSPLQ